MYLSLDEMGVLRAVTFRPLVAEWQPLSPVPRPPRCREAGQIAFAQEDINLYYYDPPSGVRLLADHEQGVFRASFGDQGGESVMIGDKCFAVLCSNNCLCGFLFWARSGTGRRE